MVSSKIIEFKAESGGWFRTIIRIMSVLEALWIVLGSEPDNFEDYIKETWRLSRYPNDDDPPEVQDELIALYGHFEDTDDEAYNVEGEDDVNMVDDA